ncbi:UNVERIFIED_CONTAM: Retrovirus-related Pol polyprotein from transposon RE2 [Sesamum indicum]
MVKQKENISDPISHFANFVHFEDQFAVNQLCRDSVYSCVFNQSSCILQDQETKEVVARGVLMNKLYILKSTTSISLLSAAVSTPHSCGAMIDCNEFVWHKRMGHASMSTIKHIPECKISKDFVDMQCDICPKANQSRISFKPSLSQSIVPFELVHLDLWGPYRTPSISGCSYVLTILDDFSSSLWTFLIKHKDQVVATLTTFSAMIERQFETKIKMLRSDNGSEFINLNCQTFCHKYETFDCPLPTVTAGTDIAPPLSSIPSPTEPRSFAEAAQYPEWREAIDAEIQALERNHGSIERHKARLVAKGYNQVKGVDFTERFSSVAKAVMRSLYGSKQASRQWNVGLIMKLQQFGFNQCAHDHGLFFLRTDHGLVSLVVYVDDILLAGVCVEELQKVKAYLHHLFTIRDMGDAHYFLGMEIARNSDGIYLAQTKYILDIIADTCMKEAKSVATPFPAGLKLNSDTRALLQAPDSYRRLIGRLLYLSFTRPEISLSIQQLSQYLNHPCDTHWNAALHVVRYLKGCPTLGLLFPAANTLDFHGYCDADWASCFDSRRSLIGFCIFLGKALISWKIKKQSTVSRSSAEAEYRSLAATVCELHWLSFLLADFGVSLPLPISLFCDNKAALHTLANPVFHERTKYIEIDCHLVRDAYKDGFIAPVLIRSFVQLADLFTKALPLKLFSTFLSKLGLVCLAPSPTCGGDVGLSSIIVASMVDDESSEASSAETGAGVTSDLLDQG